MDDIIMKLRALVVDPFSHMDRYRSFGVSPPRGVLIYGPSGVGKTSVATALVKEIGIACIYVDSAGIRSKIVGQSEQTIADLFEKARSASPCSLFADFRYLAN